MHILFISDNFPPEVNAAATRVFERARYWVQWGHKVTIITCAPNFPQGKVYPGYTNEWMQKETMEGMEIIRVKTFMARNEGFALRILDFVSFMLSASLFGTLVKNVDVVVATSPQFFAGFAGWFLSVFKWKPFVLEISDLWPESIVAVGAMKKESFIYRCLEKLELFLYGRAKQIIVSTPAFKQDLVSRGVLPSKIHAVINGVELSYFKPEPKDAKLVDELGLENKLVIGYIGTHGMAHNLKNVLIVASQLEHRLPQVHFLFVGDGAEKEALQTKAQHLALHNVTFVSAQPKTTIKKYWALCNVALVHLKDSDTFSSVIPSKMFEAMAMGLPLLLVAPKGEASQIIDENQCGIAIAADDQLAFAAAIERLSTDTPRYQTLCANALKAVSAFSRETQAKSFLTVLESAIL